MYGIMTPAGYIRSVRIQHELRMLDLCDGSHLDLCRKQHIKTIDRLEARGASYSCQDFDVLSAALSFLEEVTQWDGTPDTCHAKNSSQNSPEASRKALSTSHA